MRFPPTPGRLSQRQTAETHVMPAPKPARSTRSPSRNRPYSTASTRARGIEAALVFQTQHGQWNAQTLSHRVHDPPIGLMRNE